MESSDYEFYNLFKAEPRFLDVFVTLNPNSNYTFEPVTFKELTRSCDGLLTSDNPDEATVIFEFQMQKKADIYRRIMTEIALYRNNNPDHGVRGVIVFLNRKTDPGDPVWDQVAKTCPGLLKVLYLNEVYEHLKQTQPHSPLQAVFAPFVESDVNLIRQNAAKWSQQLDQLPYNEAQRETFFKIFMSWLTSSLPDIAKKEFGNMTTFVRDIRHTRFYKDVIEEYLQEHGQEIEGSARLKQLREMLDEGAVSQEYFDKKIQELKDQGLI